MDDDTVATQKSQRAGNMTPSLEPTPEVTPAKKKRPPRKRKKKQQQQQQNNDIDKKKDGKETNAIVKNVTPSSEQVKNGAEAEKQGAQSELVAVTKESNATSKTEPSKEAPSPPVKEPIKTEPPTKSTPTPKKSSWATVGTTKTPTAQRKPPPKPKVDAWETARKSKKATEPAWGTVKPKDNNDRWKAKGGNPTPTSSNHSPGASLRTQPFNNSLPQKPYLSNESTTQLGVAGASDWRNHTLSRNVSSSSEPRKSQQSRGPPPISNTGGWPSLSDAPKSNKADLWPSLGKAMTKTDTPSAAPQSMKPKAPQGAWVTKGGPAQSAWGKPKR